MVAETLPVEQLPSPDEASLSAQERNPGLERALEVELAIDPDHTLPDITLVSNPTRMQQRARRGSLVTENFVMMHNGEQVGSAVTATDRYAKERWFNGIEVDEVGKGLWYGYV